MQYLTTRVGSNSTEWKVFPRHRILRIPSRTSISSVECIADCSRFIRFSEANPRLHWSDIAEFHPCDQCHTATNQPTNQFVQNHETSTVRWCNVWCWRQSVRVLYRHMMQTLMQLLSLNSSHRFGCKYNTTSAYNRASFEFGSQCWLLVLIIKMTAPNVELFNALRSLNSLKLSSTNAKSATYLLVLWLPNEIWGSIEIQLSLPER